MYLRVRARALLERCEGVLCNFAVVDEVGDLLKSLSSTDQCSSSAILKETTGGDSERVNGGSLTVGLLRMSGYSYK